MEDLKALYRKSLAHIIPWKKWDEEKPPEDIEIWVLQHHWKGHFPSSFELAAGVVEYGREKTWRVNTYDYDGGGLNCYTAGEDFSYWCHKWEISVPEELISWDHNPGVL